MRQKLSEILSSIDQFNGTSKYSDQYVDGEPVEIDTDVCGATDKAIVDNDQQKTLEEMLKVNNMRADSILPPTKEYVLTFEHFIKENNYMNSSNVQSYFGCLDDTDDEEEE